MSYRWAEDDFALPSGVERLGSAAPQNNRQYVMYHGTSSSSAQLILKSGFKPSADGMLGPGVYLSRDLKKASRYPLDLPEKDRVVIKVKVNVGKVIAINYQGHPLQKTWHYNGYNTAWVPPDCGMVPSGLEEDCVWDPNRIQIIKAIQPQSVSYRWAEEDFTLPAGVERLGSAAPQNNRQYVMYHGTSSSSAQLILKSGFKPSADGMLGPGVYLSRDLKKASRYPLHLPEKDRVVIKVKVNVGKVIAINYQGHPLQKTWHYNGYNTAWVPPNCGMVPSGLEEDCVWDPNRIQIIKAIQPQSVSYRWAEEDFTLPAGVERLGSAAPQNNRQYVMYHGTSSSSAQLILKSGFKPSADGMLGPGVYLSRDLKKASRYPLHLPEKDRVVIKVKVNVGKVIAIDRQNHPLQKTWHYNGYNTAWVPPNCGMVPSGLEEDCVWDPNRIQIIKAIQPQPEYGGGATSYY